MRGRATAALFLALLACGDDDDDKPVTDASVRIDGKVAVMDAALIEMCGAKTACQSGAITQIPQLCIGSVNAQPAGDLWKICVVDPAGRASFIQIRADERITSPGWSWSNYGYVDLTLSDEGVDACLTERAKQVQPDDDDLPDAANALCFASSVDERDN